MYLVYICMYLYVFLYVFCQYMHVLHVSACIDASSYFWVLFIHANTCNTCKYWQRYVHIRIQNTHMIHANKSDPICMYLYVYAHICQYLHIWVSVLRNEWLEIFIYMQYIHIHAIPTWYIQMVLMTVYVCICMYMHVLFMYLSVH